MNQSMLRRWAVYVLGLLILALGLVWNNKCGLGTSPLSTLPYFATLAWGVDFGNGMFLFYGLCVAVQLFLKPRSRLAVLAQILVSLIFTRVLDLLDPLVPDVTGDLPLQVLMLAGAIVCTGVGVAMSLSMDLIPNPGDGVVAALARTWGKETGFAKNVVDLACTAATFLLGLATGHFLCAIGIGTLAGMLGVGRIIALFDRLYREKLRTWSGAENGAKRGRGR